MWIRVKEMASDVWRDKDGRQTQPQMREVEKYGRIFKVSVDGFPDLIGEVGRVQKEFIEEDGSYYAVHFRQDLMETCPQDYWMFRPSDVEVISQDDHEEEIMAVMMSFMRE